MIFRSVPAGLPTSRGPVFLAFDLSIHDATIYIYFLMVALAIFTIFVVNRLKDSRIGRAWIALREDEIACQAMGIDKTRTKLTAFALGATWAGMGGVVFAAKTTFINPASFTIWESVIILCVVVLGGMGSIVGVICGAMVLILAAGISACVFRISNAAVRRCLGADDGFSTWWHYYDRTPDISVRQSRREEDLRGGPLRNEPVRRANGPNQWN